MSNVQPPIPRPQPQPQPIPAPPVPGKTVDESHPVPVLNFWQTPLAQQVVPIATSVGLHLGIALMVILFMGAIEVANRAPEAEEQVVIPDSNLGDGPAGGVVNPGGGGDAFAVSTQSDVPEAEATDFTQSSAAAGLSGASDGTTDLSGFGVGIKGVTKGTGGGGGTGTGLFGPSGGGSGVNGPRSTFQGTGGNAYRIVYLCDATGTMMNVFDSVRMELQRSINNLKEIQQYNVIFFRDQQVLAFNDSNLVSATRVNQDKTTQWLDEKVTPAGQTDPFEAIRKAFAMNPQLIYVLTDGFDNVGSYEKVAEEFRKLNPDKKIKVNTILIESRPDAELRAVMKKISDESGGTFVKLNSQGM